MELINAVNASKISNYEQYYRFVFSCHYFSLLYEKDIDNSQIFKLCNNKCKEADNYKGIDDIKKQWNKYNNNKTNKIRSSGLIDLFTNNELQKYIKIDNEVVNKMIEQIIIPKENMSNKYLIYLLESEKFDEAVEYYYRYIYKTENGTYKYENNTIIKISDKPMIDNKYFIFNNKKITIGAFMSNKNIEYIFDNGLISKDYDNKPLLYKINKYNKNKQLIDYELHYNSNFVVKEWTFNNILNYDFNKDIDNVICKETFDKFEKIMYHIKHIICCDDKNKINYLMSFIKNIFKKEKIRQR